MTAPNHIIGGIAITGISLSFWNVNIFSSPYYLGVCVFASLLPDIDHTKSLVGKLFWPISKAIDKNYGHRTITHSLSFLVPLVLLCLFLELNLINPYFTFEGTPFSFIVFFGVFSHFILDMLTIQGIPLFYPFSRAPCVVPANPAYRVRSGNVKSETIAFMFFSVVVLSSYDLFINGFWTSYNRSFGTIAHVEREFKNSPNFVTVDFSYLFNGVFVSGTGVVVDASPFESIVFTNQNEILRLTAEDNRMRDIEILPSKNDMIYKINEVDFYSISIEQLTNLISNKIVSGSVLSSHDFYFNDKLINKKIEINNYFNPKFTPHVVGDNNLAIRELLSLKKIESYNLWKANNNQFLQLDNLKKALIKLNKKLVIEENLYTINKLEKAIINQKSIIDKFEINQVFNPVLEEEIRQLEQQLKIKESVKFTVNLKILEVPSPTALASY